MPDYKYLKHKRKDYRLWNVRDIENRCPQCGSGNIEMVWATVAFGPSKHLCTLYARCQECTHHFAWEEWTRAKQETVSKWLQGFAKQEAKRGNQ